MKSSHFWKIVIASFLMITLMGGCSRDSATKVNEKKAVHYQRALKYIELADHEAAKIELKNALQIDPKYAEAHYQLALLHLKMQQPAEAIRELARTVEMDPHNLDARMKLAELMFLAKRNDESKILAQNILAGNNAYVSAMSLLAQIFLAEHDIPNAELQIEKAIEIEPRTARFYVTKAQILTEKRDYDGAEYALQKALDLEPENTKNVKNIVRFYINQNKRGKAIEIMEDVVSKYSEIPALYIVLANLYEEEKQYAKAEQNLKMVTALDPENYTAFLLMGDFYKRNSKFEDAKTYYDQAVLKATNLENSAEVKAALADLYLIQRNHPSAEKAIDAVLNQNPTSRVGNLLKARLLNEKGEYGKALEILNSAFEKEEFEYYKAVAYFGIGEIQKAENSALAAQAQNQKDDRVKAILAAIVLRKGNPKEAEQHAADALRLNPNNYNAAIVLGKALIAQSKFEMALRHFTQMDAFDPNNTEIIQNIGIAQLSLKDWRAAEESFEKVLSIDPRHYQAIAYIVRIYLNRNDRPGAIGRVNAQLKKIPENVNCMILLGKLQYEEQSYESALETFQKAQSLAPDSAEASIMAARIFAKLGNIQKVIAEYQALIDKAPTMGPAYIKLGTLLEQNGDIEGAKSVYEKALQYIPDYGPAANNLAYLLMDKGTEQDKNRAMMLALKARKYDPQSPSASDTLGWVLHQKGSYLEAASHLEHAVSLLPDSPTICYHYALNLHALGENDQALKIMQKCLTLATDFPEKVQTKKLINEWESH